MINRLRQFNAFQEKIDILLAALCTYFQSLSINRKAALLRPFFGIKNNSNKYSIFPEINQNLESIISEIIRGLFFFQKIYGTFYLNIAINEISFSYHNQKILSQSINKEIKEQHIVFDFDQLGYSDELFQNLLKELPNYSKEMDFEEEIKFHIRMLKLSKKIPFNAYSYCDEYITKAYFRYNEIQFLEHKAKIVQYILDKLNEGIKNLIGSNDIKITGNFSVEEIIKKKEELKNHN